MKQVVFVGERYGRWTVVAEVGRDDEGRRQFKVVCDCGREKVLGSKRLRSGRTRSCGCAATTHGHTVAGTSPTYYSWMAMKTRTLNPNAHAFELYGGRGITVCERWRDSFEAFLEDMGERPAGRTLDRIDPEGNYEPGNCRWATPLEQRHNRRRSGDKEAA